MNRSAMVLPDNGELNTGGRQGAAAGYARQCPYGGACGDWHWQALVGQQRNKATLPFTRRTTSAVSAAAARCRCRVRTPMPLRGACGCWYKRTLVGLQGHFRGAQQARSAPRTNVRELFCGRKITRNDSDEAERSERSPSGIVSAANGEELAGVARQVSRHDI